MAVYNGVEKLMEKSSSEWSAQWPYGCSATTDPALLLPMLKSSSMFVRLPSQRMAPVPINVHHHEGSFQLFIPRLKIFPQIKGSEISRAIAENARAAQAKSRSRSTIKITNPVTDDERRVLNHLANLLETQSMADVSFVVKGEKIGAHMALLASASPVLTTMLDSKFKEGQTKIVEINDMSVSVLKEMLKFIYTGSAPSMSNAAITEPLFMAADKYQIEALKTQCENVLSSRLTITNVVKMLVLAHLHSAPKLLEASLQCITENKSTLWNRTEWKELMVS